MGNIVPIYPPYAAGRDPLRIARNGHVVDAVRMKRAAKYVNMLSATQMKVIGRTHHTVADALSSTTDTVTYRFVGHTNPCASTVRYRILCAPAASVSETVSPRFYWVQKTLNTATGPATATATVTHPAQYVTARDTGTIVPDDFTEVTGSMTVSSDTTYAWELHVADYCRPISCSLYEQSLAGFTVDVGTRNVVDPGGFAEGAPILDRDIADLLATFQTTWKRGGAQYIGWTNHDGSRAALTASATNYYNVVSGALSAAYSATAPGFWTSPGDRATLTTSTVPVVGWAYAAMSAGATGTVRFIDAGDTRVSIGSIGAEGYWFATGSADGATADRYMNIAATSGHAANTITVYAAGLYEYLA